MLKFVPVSPRARTSYKGVKNRKNEGVIVLGSKVKLYIRMRLLEFFRMNFELPAMQNHEAITPDVSPSSHVVVPAASF